MKEAIKNNFLVYLGRFILTYVGVATLVAIAFIAIQSQLPIESRVALDFFKPYKLGMGETVVLVLKALAMALVLYPFYKLIIKGRHGELLLFATLWGLVLLGSMEPKPGSIEGMIYTTTSFFEHLLVIAAWAFQVWIFAKLFLRWERGSVLQEDLTHDGYEKTMFKKDKSYFFRFTMLHIVVYIIVGSVFYQIAGYEEALATMEEFKLWRNLESLGMVAAVFMGQIARGALIALFVAPFYHIYMKRHHGWLQLFGLLFGLKVLVVLIVVPELPINWVELTVGIPEITVQTLLFSLLFFYWEKRKTTRQTSNPVELRSYTGRN